MTHLKQQQIIWFSLVLHRAMNVIEIIYYTTTKETVLR